MQPDYINANKDHWNQRTPIHMSSTFYDVPAFLNGKNSLKHIELDLLGDVTGKSILHLQCHFGQDTLSLARMGANVTGIDLSDAAIDAANLLREKLQLENKARFICCDLYHLPLLLHERFDIVFTSYGTIGWLPDMDAWAKVVQHFIKPGGHFIMAEFHPVVWMFDDDFKTVNYPYFNREVIIEEGSGTYTDRDALITYKSYSWNHGLGEVLQALLDQGLQLQQLREYDYSPYNCFKHTVQTAPDEFRIRGMEHQLPMVYALQYYKPI